MAFHQRTPSGVHVPHKTFRALIFFLVFLVLLTLFVVPSGLGLNTSLGHLPSGPFGAPPTYEELRKWEAELPQHNLSLPFPEGKNGRYVKFSNQIKELGWNNVLNEVLMNAHLAYESKRSYVFQDYYWKPSYYSWPPHQFLHSPPRTPLNAIISGPTAGGAWDDGDDAPRSISSLWFDIVCPPNDRLIINATHIKPPILEADGQVIFNTWKRILLDAPDRCIEIVPPPPHLDSHGQTFDLYLWGCARILSLWTHFQSSPTSRLLGTSPIVNAALARNEHLFFLHRGEKVYQRMLAMHLRRGDFQDACLELAKWNSTFYSWNLLPQLPDRFLPPPGGSYGTNTPQNVDRYLERCLPTFHAIVRKVRDSREDYITAAGGGRNRTLDVLYLLTNEHSEWLDELKDVLRRDGWGIIRTSRDLVLDREQTDVNMAVDMDIARRAAVFIGNGWSSFTSNIVHRRLVDGKEPISIRFY